VAQRVVTQLISDLTGDEITAGKGQNIEFSYRGASYSIDLTDKEAAGFDKAIAMYIDHATKVGGRRRPSASSSKGYNPKDVREWAKSQGIEVPQRGRIPADVVTQYQRAS
jgi:hypothetical protein